MMNQNCSFDTIDKIYKNRIIPLFNHEDIDTCKNVLKSIYDSGLSILEYTNRDDQASRIFPSLSHFAKDHFPLLSLGVGSIVDAESASFFISQGAEFIVSPVFKKDIADRCNRTKTLWIPGCKTLNEIASAWEYGAEIIKINPAKSAGGTAFIHQIKTLFPDAKLMPSGGIKPEKEDINRWLDAGSFCIGMGSALISKDILRQKDFQSLTKKALTIFNACKHNN